MESYLSFPFQDIYIQFWNITVCVSKLDSVGSEMTFGKSALNSPKNCNVTYVS
jgi:hypothetical protein